MLLSCALWGMNVQFLTWRSIPVGICQLANIAAIVAPGLHSAGVLAGKTLVEVIRALTSLQIAGGQLAVAGANSALTGIIANIRQVLQLVCHLLSCHAKDWQHTGLFLHGALLASWLMLVSTGDCTVTCQSFALAHRMGHA